MDLKRVLVADAVDVECTKLLTENGFIVDCKYKQTEEELIRNIKVLEFGEDMDITTFLKAREVPDDIIKYFEDEKDYDAIIVRSDTKITENVIKAEKNLKVIGRAGAGVDNINTSAATANKILVLNTPGGNAISACELTCSLITSLARNVVPAAASLKAGRWDRKIYSGHELYGKTLAIIGLGRIGKEVALRMQSWGMKTIGFDPIVSAEEAKQFNVESMDLEKIWPLADYITVHTPLIPQTRNMINDKVFSACKKGIRIVNVARGGIICEKGLLAALKDGRCEGAALDVFEKEPPSDPITLEIIQHPKVIATPHLGASTKEAQVRVAVEIAEQIIALSGRNPQYTETPGIINRGVLKNL